MKVLVLGGGGREHALVWALSRSARVTDVVCAPGNPGIIGVSVGIGDRPARCAAVDLGSVASMVALVAHERPALTVVGPELPLSLGIVDELQKLGYAVFGPARDAAALETSKSFAKAFMQRHEIATAAYAMCASLDEVTHELRSFSVPVVVKADGLAAGKGVVICQSHHEAEIAAAQMFDGDLLGTPVPVVVIEEFLYGEELSYFAVCDGKHAVTLGSAQDHKRVGEGDTGPNTGGMGAYTGDGLVSVEMEHWLRKNVAQVVVDEMRAEGRPFTGILFCGMMMVPQPDGTTRPMVLEFNTRFGDPETQAIVMRLETPLLDILEAAMSGSVDKLAIRMRPGTSVCVIAASGGYPEKAGAGEAIAGLEGFGVDVDVVVFHSGTAVREEQLVTAGGRVLGVTAYSEGRLQGALDKAYGALQGISFDGMQYRRDIGWRALRDGL